jgi:hypothetical protein
MRSGLRGCGLREYTLTSDGQTWVSTWDEDLENAHKSIYTPCTGSRVRRRGNQRLSAASRENHATHFGHALEFSDVEMRASSRHWATSSVRISAVLHPSFCPFCVQIFLSEICATISNRVGPEMKAATRSQMYQA